MKAVVYHGDADVRVEEVAEPTLLEPTDALVRVRRAAICGSDLHIYRGRVPGVFEGATLGHEYTGEVVAIGEQVSRFGIGDEVVGSFAISCGGCPNCRAGRFNHCENYGTLGYGVFVGDLGGSQAELVRVPYADTNLLALPAGLDHERGLFVGDVLSTGWYAASLGGITPGDTVLVVGAGPVGIFSMLAAQAMGAGRLIVTDLVADRLAMARDLGAETVDSSRQNVSVGVDDLVPGGAQVVIESVGLPAALMDAITCCRSGGTVSVIGVHTDFEYPFPLQNLFARNLTLRFGGSANVQAVWEQSLAAVVAGGVDPTRIISHRLPLAEAPEGYRLFEDKRATKVVLQVS